MYLLTSLLCAFYSYVMLPCLVVGMIFTSGKIMENIQIPIINKLNRFLQIPYQYKLIIKTISGSDNISDEFCSEKDFNDTNIKDDSSDYDEDDQAYSDTSNDSSDDNSDYSDDSTCNASSNSIDATFDNSDDTDNLKDKSLENILNENILNENIPKENVPEQKSEDNDDINYNVSKSNVNDDDTENDEDNDTFSKKVEDFFENEPTSCDKSHDNLPPLFDKSLD